MASNIYIFSRAVRSGKTTELQGWINDRDDVGGILTPDEKRLRCLLNISTHELHEFEVPAHTPNAISIGRFFFTHEAFQTAQDILLHTISPWLIIDEVGKLEVETHTGLEPTLSSIISYYHNTIDIAARLLLVIRDTLLEKAIEKYHLQKANIFHSLQDL